MGRQVSWGLYIANFTFLVGVAASAVIVVLPYYLHNYKAFGPVTVFGEFLAVAAVAMAMLFIFVDLGQPARVFNVLLHPSPDSVLFWDMAVLTLYLLLNITIGWRSLEAERQGKALPNPMKPLILLSIPAAISIHTITAFIYAGLGARTFWMTALLAPRFLASAFASGPSILVILCIILRRRSSFDAGADAVGKLTRIVTYALAVHLFFQIAEVFTALYSAVPDHLDHVSYLYRGLPGQPVLALFVWVSLLLSAGAFLFLMTPGSRRGDGRLAATLAAVVVALWIEKGPALLMPGFVPAPLDEPSLYAPTVPEVLITVGIYGVGALILGGLVKIALSVKEETLS
jgi:molybdopterin-containing oxidoreductase family membrane subunit